MDRVLFARTEHGGHKVEALARGFQVYWPKGSHTYPSARQTIIALVNKTPTPDKRAYDPHMTLDRYFRMGRYKRKTVPSIDTLDLFTPSAPTVIIARPKKGVDLTRRSHEVRKLFYAGFGQRVLRYGYDPEDVLQEVYKGILVRNQGKCPFDPSKSSFGHYVHMVCGCIVSNYRRKYSRLSRNEVVGIPGLEGDEDVASSNLFMVDPIQEGDVMFHSSTGKLRIRLLDEAEKSGLNPITVGHCFDYMLAGFLQKEMAAAAQVPLSKVSKIVRLIKKVAEDWRLSC